MDLASQLVIADLILVLHLLFVLFIVGGALLIWMGFFCHWNWIRNRKFRLIHLGAMTFVTLEAVLNLTCPLTTLEDKLRGISYEQSFVQRLLQGLLFYEFSEEVFVVVYVTFLVFLYVTWKLVPCSALKR